jgi:hypothetical protein
MDDRGKRRVAPRWDIVETNDRQVARNCNAAASCFFEHRQSLHIRHRENGSYIWRVVKE